MSILKQNCLSIEGGLPAKRIYSHTSMHLWLTLNLGLEIQNCNCNSNWGTCIAPPTRRPRVHHRVNLYPGARRQNETEMFSDHNKTSLSIAAISAPSVAYSWRRTCIPKMNVSGQDIPNLEPKHAFLLLWPWPWPSNKFDLDVLKMYLNLTTSLAGDNDKHKVIFWETSLLLKYLIQHVLHVLQTGLDRARFNVPLDTF